MWWPQFFINALLNILFLIISRKQNTYWFLHTNLLTRFWTFFKKNLRSNIIFIHSRFEYQNDNILLVIYLTVLSTSKYDIVITSPFFYNKLFIYLFWFLVGKYDFCILIFCVLPGEDLVLIGLQITRPTLGRARTTCSA